MRCKFSEAHAGLVDGLNLARPIEIAKGVPPGPEICDSGIALVHFLDLT
jgi:hypothetical protein